MRVTLLLTAITFLLISTSCSHVAITSPVHPMDYNRSDPTWGPYFTNGDAAKSDYFKATTEAAKHDAMIAYSFNAYQFYDYSCRKFLGEFFGRSSAFFTAADVASLGLSGAAGITTPITSAHFLSTLSAGISGAAAATKQQFMGDIAQQLLTQRIHSLKEQVYQDIRNNLQLPSSKYGIDSLEHDLNRYDEACSIEAALSVSGSATQPSANEKPKPGGAAGGGAAGGH
jgi:hypothetical protein